MSVAIIFSSLSPFLHQRSNGDERTPYVPSPTETVHLLPQEYFDFLKENLVAPQEYFDFLKENLVAHIRAQGLATVPRTVSRLTFLALTP